MSSSQADDRVVQASSFLARPGFTWCLHHLGMGTRRPNRADAHAAWATQSPGAACSRAALASLLPPAARSRLPADSLSPALIFPLWWVLPGLPLAVLVTPQILPTNPDPGSHQIRVGSASRRPRSPTPDRSVAAERYLIVAANEINQRLETRWS